MTTDGLSQYGMSSFLSVVGSGAAQLQAHLNRVVFLKAHIGGNAMRNDIHTIGPHTQADLPFGGGPV